MTLWVHGAHSSAACLFSAGTAADYSEAEATAITQGLEIAIRARSARQGDGAATIYTCDLSHDYVSINGHYRS